MNDTESPGSPCVPYAERNTHVHYRQPGPVSSPALRWHKQTVMYDPANPGFGDCTETAVACILGLPRSWVPSFRGGEDGAVAQHDNMQRFVESMGFALVRVGGNCVPHCLYLAIGPSARGCSHVVIMRAGELIHDPHPSNAGLTEIYHIYLLVPADPAYANTMPAHPWPEDI